MKHLETLALPSVMFEPHLAVDIRNVIYGNCSCMPVSGNLIRGVSLDGRVTEACEQRNPCGDCLCISVDAGPKCQCDETQKCGQAATIESMNDRLQGNNVEFHRPVLSSPRFLQSCLTVFIMVVISVVQGSCSQSKINISNLHFLGRNEFCRNYNDVNLQCVKDLQLCLPVVPGSDLAVGCAPDRPINGKGCPEWNNDNGCYVLNVRYNKCETCSDHYRLSNSSEVAKCWKDERTLTTEQTTGTSAKRTRDKRSSLEHGDETTAGSPNKTSGKSNGNNEPGGVIILALVLSVGAASVFIFAVIKVQNRRRNPAPEPSHELGAPVDQQQSVEPAPEQQHLVGPARVEQQQLVRPASEQ